MSASTSIIQPTRSSVRKLSACRTLQEAFESTEFGTRIAGLAPKHMDPVRLYRMFMSAASRNPDIYKVPVRTALGQFMTIATLGLEPNTQQGHAYLITFKEKVWNPDTRQRDLEQMGLQVIIGYRGYAELAWRTGFVNSLHADVVLPGDEFEFSYGTESYLKHRPGGQAEETDAPLWAYAHVGMVLEHGKGQLFEAMPWRDVMRIRNRSQAYQKALADKEDYGRKGWNVPRSYTDAPWVRDEREMGKKTAFRRTIKYMRLSPELMGASAIDDAGDEGRKLDWGLVIDEKASVIDGGIPEADDQDNPPAADPGSAFNLRSAGEVQSNLKPVREQKSQAAEATLFEGWLTDEIGEPQRNEPITDPVAYAKEVEKLWQIANNRGALIEYNLADLNEAAQCSAEAKKIVDSILPKPFSVIAVADGPAGWDDYLRNIAKALDAKTGDGVTPDRLEEWANVQGPNILRAPNSVRTRIVNLVVTWAAAAKVGLPPVIAQALVIKDAEAVDRATKTAPDKPVRPQSAAPRQDDQSISVAAENPDEPARGFVPEYFAKAFKEAVLRAYRENKGKQFWSYGRTETGLRNLKQQAPELYADMLDFFLTDDGITLAKEGREKIDWFSRDLTQREMKHTTGD